MTTNDQHLMDEIIEAYESEATEKCILLCRTAMLSTELAKSDKWLKIKWTLSKALLLKGESNSGYRDEAIEILREIITNVRKRDNPTKWAMVNLALGHAYEEKEKEDISNLDKAIRYYKEALSVFTIDKLPDEWAGTLAAIGYIYGRARDDESGNNITKAIQYILPSLQVYTKQKDPCQYWDKLKELWRLKSILQDDLVWNQIGTEYSYWEEINDDIDEKKTQWVVAVEMKDTKGDWTKQA